MLNNQQLELLKKSNKTLAIVGNFRSEDEQIRYVFKNSGEKDGKIKVADLFAKLKPELRSYSKGILKIGDTIFNQYELFTPLDVTDKSNSQSIMFDSPLLDGTIYSGEEAGVIQEQGKQVVKQLLESLNTVAYFSHSHFTKSLMKIAKHYLFEEANENLVHKIADDSQWYKTINSDRAFCSQIVQYLTAHEQDEADLETAIRLSLKSFKNSSNQKIYSDEQIDKLVEALIRCKKIMLDGMEEDGTWKKIAQTSSFSWLKNYPSDPDYGLSHPQVGKKVGDKSFLAYYNVFMESSDKIHRLVRTQAIHSSIFCWLAGKYRKWDLENRTEAAEKMFEIGIQNQGDERIRGESREARRRNEELIKQVAVEETIEQEIYQRANKVEQGEKETYKIFAQKAEDNIFNALLPDRAVSRKALRLRAKNLFKELNQRAGGKAGQILKENDEFNQLFVKYYRTILNTNDNATIEEYTERLVKESIRDKTLENFAHFDMREFLNIVINKVKEQAEEGEDKNFKMKVKETFIIEYARKSKNRFAEEYLKNLDQINEEEQKSVDLYDLRTIQDVVSQEETAGGAVYVMTDLSTPDFDNIDEDIKIIRKQKTKEQAQNAVQKNLTLSVTAPKPTAFQSVEAGTLADVTDSKGTKIGSIIIQKDNIELKAEDIKASEHFDSDEAQIDVDGKIYKLQELNIPEIVDLSKGDEIEKANKIAEEAESSYDQLSKSIDRILKKYRNEDYEEADFNRAFRSLLLCEYIQAAPTGTTQLGREDLSNILGLMVDIVEQLGEVDDSKILDTVLTEQPELERLLQKINLSKYYPVEDGPEGKRQMSLILQYQYELCKNLDDNVKKYLQELTEIKNFFEMMQRTDLEIVLINSTIREYTEIDNVDYDTFSFNVDSPALVYLTSQSQASVDSLTVMAETMAELINDYDGAKNLQIPILVSSEELPVDKIPLPVICPSNIKLPNLTSDKNEHQQNDQLNITVDWKEKQNSYLLLSAATMLLDSSIAMGSITDFKPSVSIKMRKQFDIKLKKHLQTVDLLRQFWLSIKYNLVDTLIFTKWLNLLILAKRQKNSINIKEQFGQILDEELWKYREKPEICNAAFATFKDLATLPMKVEFNGQFSSPSSLGGGNFGIKEKYGTAFEKEERYVFETSWKDSFTKILNG
ncbi:MAG: hypothetical protein WBF90_12825 [Rivularia sp. (in: cyanobacteria)]